MRQIIISNLSNAIDQKVVEDLISTYEDLVTDFRKGDIDGCLTISGRFVEHTLRAIEFIRTGTAPVEIKSVSQTVKKIEQDGNLSESIRLLIPRVSSAMIYDIRSKRGTIHVKEVDPRHIDASLAVQAASWVISEFLRLYHNSNEKDVVQAIDTLMRGHISYVESFGDEVIVTKDVPCEIELLLLLVKFEGAGLNRTALGRSSKNSSATVTRALGRLDDKKFIHKKQDGCFHITGPGEKQLSEHLASIGLNGPK